MYYIYMYIYFLSIRGKLTPVSNHAPTQPLTLSPLALMLYGMRKQEEQNQENLLVKIKTVQ